jgi:uncharacterized membrane protein
MEAYGIPWGGIAMMILFLALAVVVALLAFRALRSRKGDAETAKEKGIGILVERFARGEIDAEAFKSMKAQIEGMK